MICNASLKGQAFKDCIILDQSFNFALILIFLPNNNFNEFVKLKISDPNLLNNSFSKSTILSIILLIKSFPAAVRIKLSDLLSCGCCFDINFFSSR